MLRKSLLFAGSMALLGGSVSAENWPHWRGPAGSGVSGETGLPLRWSDSENLAWKTRLGGYGISSPVVWGEQVFVTRVGVFGAAGHGATSRSSSLPSSSRKRWR